MAKDGCCSTTCLKNALNFFNLLLLFTAFGLLAVTIWILGKQSDLIILLSSATYSVLINFVLIAGALLLLLSFLGCYAVIKENRKILIAYVFILLFIILMELMVALLGYIYKENVNDELTMSLNNTMLENYGINEEKTEAIDYLQKQFSCCGAVQFEDWQYSNWRKNNITQELVPDSCCKTILPGCGMRDHPSNINYDGCLEKIEHQMKNSLIVMTFVALGVGISQIIGLVVGIKLYLSLKEEDEIDITELRRFLHYT